MIRIKHSLVTMINSILHTIDAEIVRASELDRFRNQYAVFPRHPISRSLLPKGAERYLRTDNPRLKELKARYSTLPYPATEHSTWADVFARDRVDLQFFRESNNYVWQIRELNSELAHALTAYYIQTIDKLGLLGSLEEDGLFGSFVYNFNNEKMLTRDLLDSIVEIYFLERKLGLSSLSNVNIMDIGAGYGRLAHPMVKSLPNLGKYICVDAIGESTFLSEYYLSFRGVDQQAIVVPLFEIEEKLANISIDIAINVHSFSECTLAATSWWLDILKKYKVKYLMITPNPARHGGTKLLSRERDGACLDLLPLIHSRGYRMIVREPKYLHSSVQKHGLYPTYHWLFELTVSDLSVFSTYETK